MHTKAPWKYVKGIDNLGDEYLEFVAGTILSANHIHIARIWSDASRDNNPKEIEANAHLIAAAPELLEACKAALNYLPANDGMLTGEPDGYEQLRICNNMKSAIAKAEGK